MLLFDIGANIGAWAIANTTSQSKIISVEASPITYELLVTAVKSRQSIIPINYAICEGVSAFIPFYHCTTANTISTLDKNWLTSPESRFGSYRNNIKEISVPTKTIDALIIEYGVPDLLKIDVEGAENMVLKSLSQKVPLLCVEWAAEWLTQTIECIDRLVYLGFTRFHLQVGDAYTYRPSVFEYSSSDLINILKRSIPKKDWGMIWAIC